MLENRIRHGRRHNRCPSLLACFVLFLALSPSHAQQVLFDQSSDPPGFLTSSTYVESGTNVITTNAPLESSGYRFTHWTLNDVRQDDPLGRARNPVRFNIYENTYAVAHYLSATNDTDVDGIPDWFEIHFYGSTNNLPTSDTDADTYNLDVEYRRDYHPSLKDEIQDGGITRRRSLQKIVIFNPDYYLFTEKSAPPGFVDRTVVVSNGDSIVTTSLNGDNAGYSFGYWDVNGQRQADITGRGYCRPTVTVTTTTVATAHYYLTTEDMDADGLPDWWEWLHSGSLTNGPSDNPDGDGYNLDIEYRRDYHPGVKDEIQDGGISRRRSDLVSVNLAGYYEYTISSDPPGFVQQSGYAQTGTVIKTSILNGENAGYMFAYWTVNGVRRTDVTGRALNQATFVVITAMQAVAYYYLKAQDTDADGLADWWEWQNFGTLTYGASDDPDGDGYNLQTEFNRDYQPLVGELIQDGGISRRRSEKVAIDMQFFERVEYALVDSILTNFYTVWPTDVSGFFFGTNTAVGVGDWDGNGTRDIFIGSADGQMRIYENIGTRYTLNLADRTAAFAAIADGWSGIPNPCPALGDWNGDGKDDLAVGGDAGRIRIISSTGNFLSPQTPAVNYDLAVAESISAVPAFTDITGDDRLDMLVLLADGTVRVYQNTGNGSVPFEENTYTNGLLGTSVPCARGTGTADVNNDGFLDVLVADDEGRIWDFRGSASGDFTLKSKVWAGSGCSFADRLTLGPADMDGDGDIDALCGFLKGGLMHLRDPRLGVPNNLCAFSGARSIRLEWEPNREFRIKGYNVYRAYSSAGPFEKLTASWITDPEYLDESVTVGTTNYYRVTSVTYSIRPGTTLPVVVESSPSEIAWGVAGCVTLTMPDYVGTPGTSTVMSLNLANARDIVGDGLEIRLNYDPAVIKPITQVDAGCPTVEKTVLTSSLNITDNASIANGTLIIQGSGTNHISGEGRIFDIVWQVDTGAVAGTQVTNTITSVTLKDSHGSFLTVDCGDTAVLTVQALASEAYFRGDVNGDGILNQDDFTLAMKLAVGQRVPTPQELMAGDLNGNGRIDKDDAHLILRMIHGQRINP